jgi:glycosyltransferase involved in cell wall biosynthesis
MKIHLAAYMSIMLNRGGPTYKIQQMYKSLKELDVDVCYFDMWDKDLKLTENDLVHIFNASVNTYGLAKNLTHYGAKYVINPIFFSNHPAWKIKLYQNLHNASKLILKRSYSDYDFTLESCWNAQKVLPNTIAEGEILVKGLGVDKAKIQVIHNGVEKRFTEGDSKLFKDKYGLEDFVLYVGHLGSYRKNGVNIIKALQKLDHQAVIIADVLKNKEGNWCRQQITESKNITLIEWIAHDDPLLASAYAAANTFILPTMYETPGRAALEAGLANCKIIITPYGGTKEYFRDYVEYVEPRSINAILRSIENTLNQQVSPDLQTHIISNFTWGKIAQKTLDIYQKI